MPQAAEDRDRVWIFAEEVPHLINDDSWVDLYALLNVPRDASAAQLEEAIVSRGADILTLSFARGVPERLRILAEFLPDLRPILLHSQTRASYDRQLELHEAGAQDAVHYEVWLRTSVTRLTRLKHRSASWFRRTVVNLWDNDYI